MEQLGGSTVKDFAARWGIGESTTWLYIRQGLIRVVRFGSSKRPITRIPFSEEKRLLEQGGIGSCVGDSLQHHESA